MNVCERKQSPPPQACQQKEGDREMIVAGIGCLEGENY